MKKILYILYGLLSYTDVVISQTIKQKSFDNHGIYLIFVIISILIILTLTAWFIDRRRTITRKKRDLEEQIRLQKKKQFEELKELFTSTYKEAQMKYTKILKKLDDNTSLFDAQLIKNHIETRHLALEETYNNNDEFFLTNDDVSKKLTEAIKFFIEDMKYIDTQYLDWNNKFNIYSDINEILLEKQKVTDEMFTIEKQCSDVMGSMKKLCGENFDIDMIIVDPKTSAPEIKGLFEYLEKEKENINSENAIILKKTILTLTDKIDKYREMLELADGRHKDLESFVKKYNRDKVSRELMLLVQTLSNKLKSEGITHLHANKVLQLNARIIEFKDSLPLKSDNPDWLDLSITYNLYKDEIQNLLDDMDSDINKSSLQSNYGTMGRAGTMGLSGSSYSPSGSYAVGLRENTSGSFFNVVANVSGSKSSVSESKYTDSVNRDKAFELYDRFNPKSPDVELVRKLQKKYFGV